ncbi:MAG: hypothetical protein Q9225_004574 [Loekoesia sp. 1 TL-2023]
MGVTGLWSILQPCARPIKIETLNRKRLAVDASIWIYQFLKAVRDKEGNALRNSHVVGFFRRICKLLFFGIKPVFVFDGGAPALKRQTISGRKKRREGRREDAVRTAGRLLAVQVQRRAEEEDRRRRDEVSRAAQEDEEEEVVPETLVYVDELQMTAQERQQNRQFKKKDAYHLPNLDVSLAEMGAPNDPRIMSHEELEEYARQFHTGEDINVYDFSKIDFNGPFFQSLPASDRYNILNAARLRSRLRMGYSKEQLDTMFPDRMAFSKFQVERVRERNELTQRLMNINGMNGDEMFNGGGRVAGEKGKEYVLVKNDGVEGGWALGVVSNKAEGERNKPIDVEGYDKPPTQEEEASEEEGFEDVPIEGLNRLPKRGRAASTPDYNDDYDPEAMSKRRRALYEKRLEAAMGQQPDKPKDTDQDPAEHGTDSLFLPEEITEQDLEADEEGDALFEDVSPPAEDEDEELRRAIAMSLEYPDSDQDTSQEQKKFQGSYTGPRIDMPLDFNQQSAKVGRNFAHQTNARAQKSAPKPSEDQSDDEEDFNLQAALEESRQSKRKPTTGPRVHGFKRADETTSPASTAQKDGIRDSASPTKPSPARLNHGFGGPLPFESLNLGKSILKKKKKEPVPEEEAGGFERESEEPEVPQFRKEKPPQPLPPWFTGDIRKDEAAEAARDEEEGQYDDGNASGISQLQNDRGPLMRQETGEVIDLDAPPKQPEEVIKVDSSGDEGGDEVIVGDTRPIDNEVRMGDIADLTRAEPPRSSMPPNNASHGKPLVQDNGSQNKPRANTSEATNGAEESNSEEPIEWDESDYETEQKESAVQERPETPPGGRIQREVSKSLSPEFEDVQTPASPPKSPDSPNLDQAVQVPSLPQEESIDIIPAEDEAAYSDPEDEDLMRQLAIEAEEHARFASTLNAKSQAQNAEEYEKELRQLRNQQKKDRRDADEVTHVMVTECQQLLKFFGLPYITAPMEAEAQCAELVSLGLVDGIVTDDSDIFLFGGTRVYKNMFNQAKFVECYLTSDLEKEYSLDRQKLISVAHLLGSDYTEGIPSVGPVTALEILSEFDTLEEFAQWCNNVQLAQKLTVEDSANHFRRKFRKQAQKLFLPSPFPDRRVDVAYLNPEVDSDPSSFEWGVPDLNALRSFLMATIGWTQERTDEVLVPVIRDMNRRETEGTQANITQFFAGGTGVGARQTAKDNNNSAFAPRRRVEGKSRRMETALGRLHEQARKRTIGEGEAPEAADVDGEVNGVTSTNRLATEENIFEQPKKSKSNQSAKRAASRDKSASASDNSHEDDEYEAPKRAKTSGKKTSTRVRVRKRTKAG